VGRWLPPRNHFGGNDPLNPRIIFLKGQGLDPFLVSL